ncbi:MAG: nucleotidyltransferase domain-containing protein [Syntrophothermus sp.]
MVNAAVINIVREYLHELSEKGVFISRCFLYGSQARNTATKDSDIDLMLVSPLFDEDGEKYWPALWLSDIRTDNRIEPLAVGEKRFLTDNISPIIEIVRQEGIEIAA